MLASTKKYIFEIYVKISELFTEKYRVYGKEHSISKIVNIFGLPIPMIIVTGS